MEQNCESFSPLSKVPNSTGTGRTCDYHVGAFMGVGGGRGFV